MPDPLPKFLVVYGRPTVRILRQDQPAFFTLRPALSSYDPELRMISDRLGLLQPEALLGTLRSNHNPLNLNGHDWLSRTRQRAKQQ